MKCAIQYCPNTEMTKAEGERNLARLKRAGFSDLALSHYQPGVCAFCVEEMLSDEEEVSVH